MYKQKKEKREMYKQFTDQTWMKFQKEILKFMSNEGNGI